jgi:hypothetical protein
MLGKSRRLARPIPQEPHPGPWPITRACHDEKTVVSHTSGTIKWKIPPDVQGARVKMILPCSGERASHQTTEQQDLARSETPTKFCIMAFRADVTSTYERKPNCSARSDGHSCVGSRQGVKRGGREDRRRLAELRWARRWFGPPRTEDFGLRSLVESTGLRKSATPRSADSSPAVGITRNRARTSRGAERAKALP